MIKKSLRAYIPEAKGCADDLHRTIWASFHGDSFEFRSCLFRSDASANDRSNRCLQKSTLPVLFTLTPLSYASRINFRASLYSIVLTFFASVIPLFAQKLKYCAVLLKIAIIASLILQFFYPVRNTHRCRGFLRMCGTSILGRVKSSPVLSIQACSLSFKSANISR